MKIALSAVTIAEMIVSLRSHVCPACATEKIGGHSVCRRRCWMKLSKKQKADLYLKVGKGYEPAFHSAMRALEVNEITLPDREYWPDKQPQF